MSFFGFDTTLPPREELEGKGSSLDAKLAALGEDIQVYDFGGDAYAALETGADELNDETFGGGLEEQKRDFDYVGSTAKLDLGGPPPPKPGPSKPPSAAWLDVDPLLGPAGPLPARQSSQQSHATTAPRAQSSTPQYKTLAEVEAELQASRQQGRSSSPARPLMTYQSSQPRSVAEIEAEMRAQQQRQSHADASRPPQQPPFPPQPLQHQGGPPPHMGRPMPPPPMLNGAPIPDFAHLHPAQFNHMLSRFPPEQQQMIVAAQTFYRDHRMSMPPFPGPMPPQPPPPGMGPGPGPNRGQPVTTSQQMAMAYPAQAPPQPSMFPALPSQPPEPSPLESLRQMREQQAATADPQALAELEAAIRKHEIEEQKTKRRLKKIEAMAGDNGLMSRSDKDFITRIQVSQLVNSAGPQGSHDPYADDFYYHVYTAIRMSRGGGEAANKPHQPAGALASKQAMRKMAMQVQRIVDDSRKRPKSDQLALDGALGKIARGGRAAPRQALAVGPEVNLHKKMDSLPLAEATSTSTAPPAFSQREALLELENLYTTILAIENMRRNSPQLATEVDPALAPVMAPVDPEEAERFRALRKELWSGLRVMDPLDGRDPHPFVSLLTPNKGKRLIPRVLRQTNAQESLTLLTLLVATFGTLDVVRRSAVLDDSPAPGIGSDRLRERADVEAATETFMSTVVPSAISLLGTLSLRIIAGLLGLLVGRNDIAVVARSRPGVAFLTILLTRGGGLKQEVTEKTSEGESNGTANESQDVQIWNQTYNALFTRLAPHWLSLFPSTRAAARLPPGHGQLLLTGARLDIDNEDAAVWQLLAAAAVCADMQQQQTLVAEVRDKVLENVFAAKRKTVAADIAERKLRNVDTFLHALGLSSSQIQLDE